MAEGGWDGRRRVGRVEQPVVWLKEDETVGGGWGAGGARTRSFC